MLLARYRHAFGGSLKVVPRQLAARRQSMAGFIAWLGDKMPAHRALRHISFEFGELVATCALFPRLVYALSLSTIFS